VETSDLEFKLGVPVVGYLFQLPCPVVDQRGQFTGWDDQYDVSYVPGPQGVSNSPGPWSVLHFQPPADVEPPYELANSGFTSVPWFISGAVKPTQRDLWEWVLSDLPWFNAEWHCDPVAFAHVKGMIDGLPHVSSLDPTTAADSDPITITGYNFTGTTDVQCMRGPDGVGVDDFTVVSDTEITTTVPALSDGVSTWRITNANGPQLDSAVSFIVAS
jgi:hypothetical protein